MYQTRGPLTVPLVEQKSNDIPPEHLKNKIKNRLHLTAIELDLDTGLPSICPDNEICITMRCPMYGVSKDHLSLERDISRSRPLRENLINHRCGEPNDPDYIVTTYNTCSLKKRTKNDGLAKDPIAECQICTGSTFYITYLLTSRHLAWLGSDLNSTCM
jgi:hypothetical protein